ncbi:rhomboid-like protein [Streptomyces sp. NBC_01429]|uniref:rhomboid-like protein n=1 Tax=Streptomyces sp. NBC_01429 TaxID=2903862 RepID=UPI002E2BD758|nr:rhomboid-like protein [Streptomyces sp. NBC_01429]
MKRLETTRTGTGDGGAAAPAPRLDAVPAPRPAVRAEASPPEEAASTDLLKRNLPEADLLKEEPLGEAPTTGRQCRTPLALRHARLLLPGPVRTPFTFWYALLLIATSLFAEYAERDTVSALLRASSTDAAHLAHTPVLVLVASALWVAGGLASPYAVGFVLVLTALERRIGGWRTAGVFLLGHVVATLATEIPVGISVAGGQLPVTSLHRLDYGISFGLMASIGALAGLLAPLPRWILLGAVGVTLLQELLEFDDPLTGWGHPVALLVGVACWPALRRVGLRLR